MIYQATIPEDPNPTEDPPVQDPIDPREPPVEDPDSGEPPVEEPPFGGDIGAQAPNLGFEDLHTTLNTLLEKATDQAAYAESLEERGPTTNEFLTEVEAAAADTKHRSNGSSSSSPAC